MYYYYTKVCIIAGIEKLVNERLWYGDCLLYTSDAADE